MINQNILFPVASQSLVLKGPAGDLELAISIPENDREEGVAIICHPHPQQEGTMNNKVVTTLARAYNHLGMPAVRFNFRGVGQSTGSYGEGLGECGDLKAVWDWVTSERPKANIYLAGFSFGAYISLRVATERAPHCLVSISPPVQYPWFKTFQGLDCPWLIVQGLDDEVVLPGNVRAFVDGLSKKPGLIEMERTGHFFHGVLIPLRESVEAWVRQQN